MYELYYYGNGPTMAQVITSAAYVLNSSSYYTLIQAIMVLAGVLMVVTWHSTHARGGLGGHGLGIAFMVLATLYYGGYAPKTDVVVNDPLNSFVTSVRHIPQGFAIVLWSSNQVARGFADLFDAAFTNAGFPDEFSYQNSGETPKALMTVSAIGHISPNDAYLFMTTENYIKNCYMTAVLLGRKNINDIRNSTNLLDEIDTDLNNTWQGTYYSASYPSGKSESCHDLYNDMKNDLDHAIATGGSVSKQLYFFLKSLGVPRINSDTDAQNVLQAAGNYMLGGSASSQLMLSQAVLINAFNPQMIAFAEQSGFNPEAFNMAITQSALNTTTTMTTSYALASTFLPLSYLVVNSFVIAILPILFAMMFVPSLTKKYGTMAFDLLMWIALWGPIASVVNFIIQSYAASSMHPIFGGNITYSMFPFLMAHSKTLMAVAGDIMFSVPVIAFALSSGSVYAMTSAVGGIAGLSKAAASNASARMTTAAGIRSEESAAKENVGEGQAVKDYMEETGSRNVGDALYGVEHAGAQYSAKQMELMRNYVKNMSPSRMARIESEWGLANLGAEGANLGQFGQGGVTKAMMNNLANTLGKGTGYGSMGKAAITGETQSKAAVGAANALRRLAKDNNTTVEKLSEEAEWLSKAGALSNYKALMGATGGDQKEAQDLLAMNMLNNIRDNKAEMDLLKKHFLPSDFDSLSAPQQLKTLAGAALKLGGTVRGVNLNQEEARRLLGPNAHAGEYNMSFDHYGRLVKAVSKGGYDAFYIDPNTGQVVKEDSPITRDNKVAAPVYENAVSGKQTAYYDRKTADMLGGTLAKVGGAVTGEGLHIRNWSDFNKLQGQLAKIGVDPSALSKYFESHPHEWAEFSKNLNAGAGALLNFTASPDGKSVLTLGSLTGGVAKTADQSQYTSNAVTDLQNKTAVGENVSTGNALKATTQTYLSSGKDSGFTETVKNVAEETGSNKKLISAGASDFGSAVDSVMVKRLNIDRNAQYRLKAGFGLDKVPIIGRVLRKTGLSADADVSKGKAVKGNVMLDELKALAINKYQSVMSSHNLTSEQKASEMSKWVGELHKEFEELKKNGLNNITNAHSNDVDPKLREKHEAELKAADKEIEKESSAFNDMDPTNY